MEVTQASIDKWMDKEVVVQAIKRNEIGSFVAMWMNLESVVQREVSQREKNKYCFYLYINAYI